MIQKLLIANRGDVCRRIVSTASKLDITAVVLQEGSVPPRHIARYAGVEFVRVDAGVELACYLDGDFWIDLARQTGCDAIHPGWGFLAEDHRFAQQCLDAKLRWVGPPPAAIKAMGAKVAGKQLAQQCGIPVIHGSEAPLRHPQDILRLQEVVQRIGYPLVVKAVAGGGGRALQVVRKEVELEPALLRVAREGESYFGDDRFLMEAYYPEARHIEIQIVRDQAGQCITLGSRDGSVQRRYQKFLEESPTIPGVNAAASRHEAMIRELERYSCELAHACHYQGVGTVEFLVRDASQQGLDQDDDEASLAQSVVFIEMNTRLQVEHPVTEEVWGVDLVAWQLQLAAGQTLAEMGVTSGQLLESARGRLAHSMQARICAEDPLKEFRPSEGQVLMMLPRPYLVDELSEGIQSATQRYETAVEAGSYLGSTFDSLMAKVVVTASSRPAVVMALRQALSELIYVGPQTNQEFVMTLLEDPRFQQGQVHSEFVDRHYQQLCEQTRRNTEPARHLLRQVMRVMMSWMVAPPEVAVSSQAGGVGVSGVARKIAEIYGCRVSRSKPARWWASLMDVLIAYSVCHRMVKVRGGADEETMEYVLVRGGSWAAIAEANACPSSYAELDLVLVVAAAQTCWVMVRTRAGWMAREELSPAGKHWGDEARRSSPAGDSERREDGSSQFAPRVQCLPAPDASADDAQLIITSPLSGRLVGGVAICGTLGEVVTAATVCVRVEAMKMESNVYLGEFMDARQRHKQWVITELRGADMVAQGDVLMVLKEYCPDG